MLPHFDEVVTSNDPSKEPVWLQLFRVVFTDRLAAQTLFEGVNMSEEAFRFAVSLKKKRLYIDYNEHSETFLQHKLGARLAGGETVHIGDVVVELYDKKDVIYQRSYFGGCTLEDVHLDVFSWGDGQANKYTSWGFDIKHEKIAEGQLELKYKTWRVEQLPKLR